MNKLRLLSLLSLLSIFSSYAHADLVFSAPPRGSEANERAIYEPLAKAMSEWISTKVVYENPKDFMTYSFQMRKGNYDIVFDGPHFSSWRAVNLKHQILVNLPEKLVFLVVTTTSNSKVKNLDDLIAKRVCGQAPPQLGTLFLMTQYNNPVREPILQTIAGEANVYESLKSGSCEVAILRDKTFFKMSDAERATYKTLYSSRPVPNDAITAGPKVTAEQRRILIEKLTNANTVTVAQPIFDKFSKNAVRFEISESEKFEGLDMLLKELSYGW